MKRRSFLQLLGLASLSVGAWAQPASGRMRLVVPLGAGSVSDYVSRLISPYLAAGLGHPVIVENKPGGNGIIGVQDVMRSPPDGGAILLGSVSPLAINVAMMKNLPYDPRRDLTPIAGVYFGHHVLAVKSTFPARSFPEFLAYVKQRPGKVSIGTSANLVKAQILAINRMAGVEILAVPYKETSATFTDLLGGTTDAALTDITTVMPHVKGGQVRVLAVTALKRNPAAPDWPAISETLPGFDFSSWSALVGPSGMSRDTVNRINAAVGSALGQKELLDKLAQAGLQPWGATPDELKAHVAAQTNKWIRLAAELNMQPE